MQLLAAGRLHLRRSVIISAAALCRAPIRLRFSKHSRGTETADSCTPLLLPPPAPALAFLPLLPQRFRSSRRMGRRVTKGTFAATPSLFSKHTCHASVPAATLVSGHRSAATGACAAGAPKQS